MDSASSRNCSSSPNGARGCSGFGEIASTGTSKTADDESAVSSITSSEIARTLYPSLVAPGMSAFRPRPRPGRCLGMDALHHSRALDDFLGQLLVGQRAGGASVVLQHRQAEAW